MADVFFAYSRCVYLHLDNVPLLCVPRDKVLDFSVHLTATEALRLAASLTEDAHGRWCIMKTTDALKLIAMART
jgi:hypothetical protein